VQRSNNAPTASPCLPVSSAMPGLARSQPRLALQHSRRGGLLAVRRVAGGGTAVEELREVMAGMNCEVRKLDALPEDSGRLDRTRPWLVRGACEGWKSGALADRENFLARFGHFELKLRHCEGLYKYSFASPWRETVSLREYFADEQEDLAVLFENNFLESEMQLAMWSDICVPRALGAMHAEPIFSAGRLDTYVGFHRHQESFLAQLHGRKVWFLAPPEREMPPVREPWEYVRQRPEGVLCCIARPGDILYLPTDWWHATWNLDDFTVAIGWEGGWSSDWHPGMHAVADGDLQALSAWRAAAVEGGGGGGEVTQDMLYLGTRTGHVAVLEALLEWSDIASPPPFVVAGAAIGGHVRVLELLEPSVMRHQGRWHPWVLHAAALCGQDEVAGWLLERRASVEARDGLADGEWAPPHAIQRGHPWAPLHTAAWNGHSKIVIRLLAARAQTDPSIGAGPAVIRVPQGRPPSGAGVDGATPLHLAAQRGHRAVVEALLAARAPVNPRDARDATPLQRAAQAGHRAVADLLIAAGADASSAMSPPSSGALGSSAAGRSAAAAGQNATPGLPQGARSARAAAALRAAGDREEEAGARRGSAAAAARQAHMAAERQMSGGSGCILL